jgi:hypothetical protein
MIDWSKPIVPARMYSYRTDAEVLKICDDGTAVILYEDSQEPGTRCVDIWSADTEAWRNVPELTERERWLMERTANGVGLSPALAKSWVRANATKLAKECPHARGFLISQTRRSFTR